MSGKKAGLALPAVAVYAVIAIMLILMGYSVFFFGLGYGYSKSSVIKAEQFQSDIMLINLLKTEVGGKPVAEIVSEEELDRNALDEALALIPGSQMLIIKKGSEKIIVSESSEDIKYERIQSAVLPGAEKIAEGIIEVKLYA